MGEVINLRQARKARERAAREAEASRNRALFGRTKAEKETTRGAADLQARRLDGHRRDEPDESA